MKIRPYICSQFIPNQTLARDTRDVRVAVDIWSCWTHNNDIMYASYMHWILRTGYFTLDIMHWINSIYEKCFIVSLDYYKQYFACVRYGQVRAHWLLQLIGLQCCILCANFESFQRHRLVVWGRFTLSQVRVRTHETRWASTRKYHMKPSELHPAKVVFPNIDMYHHWVNLS